MSSSRALFTAAFGPECDLYTDVLCLPSNDKTTATTAMIRKAYHRRALKFHPDKQNPNTSTPEELAESKLKFQAVSLAYEILSKDESRSLYDETGEFYHDDDDNGDGDGGGVEDWINIFATMFGKVTEQDITDFEKKYKRSDEEEQDVLKYYKMCKGNLNKMLTCVMLSEEEDKDRWITDYIQPAIDREDVPNYAQTLQKTGGNTSTTKRTTRTDEDSNTEDEDYETDDDDDDDHQHDDETDDDDATVSDDDDTVTDEDDDEEEVVEAEILPPPHKKTRAKPQASCTSSSTKKKKNTPKLTKAQKEAKEAEDLMAKIRGKGNNALGKRREQNFNSLLSNMEAKYGGGSGADDIPDDEFERIQSKLKKGGKRKRT